MKQLGIRIMPILLVLLLMLSACGTQNAKNQTPKADGNAMHEPVAQAVVEFLTFEDALQRCTDIIRARFVGCHNYETYRELEFDVLEIAKGSTTVKTIYILEQFSTVSVLNTDMLYTSGIYEYEIGAEYLLVLERNVSIYQEHERYVQLSDIYIPLSNLSESQYTVKSSETTYQTLQNYRRPISSLAM